MHHSENKAFISNNIDFEKGILFKMAIMGSVGHVSHISEIKLNSPRIITFTAPGSAVTRHLHNIDGHPFESLVVHRRKYLIPYLCDSCSYIRDDLVDVSHTGYNNIHQTRVGLLDPYVSEWKTPDPFYSSLFYPECGDAYYNQRTSRAGYGSSTNKDKNYKAVFKSGVVQCVTPDNNLPVVLKYSHKGTENPYYIDSQNNKDNVTELRRSVDNLIKESSEFIGDLADNSEACGSSSKRYFNYIDSRLVGLSKEQMTHNTCTTQDNALDAGQVTPDDIKVDILRNQQQMHTDMVQDIISRFPGGFIHYYDSKLHIEQYKRKKQNIRQRKQTREENTSRKLYKSSAHASQPQLPEAFKAGWQFWEVFDSASKRHRSKLGDGYISGQNSYTLLPKIDVTKESVVNLTVMQLYKRDKQRKHNTETYTDKFIKKNMKRTQEQFTNIHGSTDQHSNLYEHKSLKGRTAPKHFVDNFNTLRVKTTKGKMMDRKMLERFLKFNELYDSSFKPSDEIDEE